MNIVLRTIRITVLLTAVALMLDSCIEPWDSGIEEQKELIAIDAKLIRGDSIQTINITRSTTLVDPMFLALRDCEVWIEDALGNLLYFEEVADGVYTCPTGEDDLVVGREYRLIVDAPSGARYESAFERMNGEVPVDSVYFEIANDIDPLTGLGLSGIQFYTDLRASDTASRYFRWKLEETWEYTATAPISYYYDIVYGRIERLYLDNTTQFYRCWITQKIPDLFVDNTIRLESNTKKQIPLKFVSTQTDRLRIRYSLLVRQYTLNEEAYRYWDQNRVSLQESGGLYSSQPSLAITNITNVSDTTAQVLGYFWAASVTSRRLTFNRPPGIAVPDEFCDLVDYAMLDEGRNPKYPRYIYFDLETGLEMTNSAACFICTISKKGTLERPEFMKDY